MIAFMMGAMLKKPNNDMSIKNALGSFTAIFDNLIFSKKNLIIEVVVGQIILVIYSFIFIFTATLFIEYKSEKNEFDVIIGLSLIQAIFVLLLFIPVFGLIFVVLRQRGRCAAADDYFISRYFVIPATINIGSGLLIFKMYFNNIFNRASLIITIIIYILYTSNNLLYFFNIEKKFGPLKIEYIENKRVSLYLSSLLFGLYFIIIIELILD